MAEQVTSQNGFIPKDGFVPDAKTAVAIAEAVLIPIYGKEQINSEKPLKANLKDGIWPSWRPDMSSESGPEPGTA